jgi:hypothetical protein
MTAASKANKKWRENNPLHYAYLTLKANAIRRKKNILPDTGRIQIFLLPVQVYRQERKNENRLWSG